MLKHPLGPLLFGAAVLVSLATPVPAAGQTASGIDPALLAKAAGGDSEAQAALGYAYENTEGQADHARAAYWYRKSAEAGNPAGEEGWAVLCKLNFDDLGQYGEAAGWFQKAAEQGNVSAEKDLGAMYENGDALPQDYARAAYWYGKAAEQGDSFAEYRLGELYLGGDGVPLDSEKGTRWLTVAAANGDLDARAALAGDEQIQALLAEVTAEHRSRQICIIRLVILAAVSAFGLYGLFHQRRRVLRLCRGAIPKSSGGRKMSVILPAACWCSACCLYQVLNPALMRRPVTAAVTAILLSSPAVILGAVALWWLSQRPEES